MGILDNLKKGIYEGFEEGDPGSHAGGVLGGITGGINEIFEQTVNYVPPLLGPDSLVDKTFELLGLDAPSFPTTQFDPLPNDIQELHSLHPQGYKAGIQNPDTLDPDSSELYKHHAKEHGANAKAADIIIKEVTARLNSVLEERSYLDFYFPNSKIGQRRVVMWENPEINESRSPRYAKQAIIQRNEPVRLFVGAEPRKVKIRFNYTLPLIDQFLRDSVLPKGFDNAYGHSQFLSNIVDKFFGVNNGTFKIDSSGGEIKMMNSGTRGPRFEDDGEPVTGIGERTGEGNAGDTLKRNIETWNPSFTPKKNRDFSIMYTHFVIDTLRASVVGDEIDSTKVYGPPIVRFRHGTVFNEAPFIVRNFSVNYSNTDGYEPRTLLPRKISITVDLEEFRQVFGAAHGDLNEPLPGAATIVDLDNSDRKNYPKL
tara:strand:- start:24673 stop:25950 length:1278 start_codon:yes stop_codon:yes gene_type:complete